MSAEERILATHLAFQLVHRRRFRPADDIERHSLVGTAAKAFDLEVQIASIQRIAQGGGGLGRALEASMRLFQASQANLSARLRASVARSSEARTEAP